MIKYVLLVAVLLTRSILAVEAVRAVKAQKEPVQCWYNERYQPINCEDTQADEDRVFNPLNVPCFCISGPTGKKGEHGHIGNQGFEGAQGPAGPQGLIGFTGPMGPAGPAGNPGIQGPPGDAGSQGPQGIQGPMGVGGAKGEGGAPGDSGPQGPPGPAGPEGEPQIVEIYDYAYMYRELMTIQEYPIPNLAQIALNVDGPFNETSYVRENTYGWTILQDGMYHISFVIGTQGPGNIAIAINETFTPQTIFSIGAGQLQIQGFTVLSLPTYTRVSLMHVDGTNDLLLMTDPSNPFHKCVSAALLIERYGTYVPPP